MKVGVLLLPDRLRHRHRRAGAVRSRSAASSRCSCASTRTSPSAGASPFPGGGELPKRYKHTHDPFVALSFAAAATKKLKLGTGICLIPQRDPIVTAKSVASLDQLSGGRFVLAMGGGWNVEEMENHGAKYDTRFKLLRERVLAMKELWTKEEAEFHGAIRQLRPGLVLPQAQAAAASPDLPGRRERPHLEARGGVLRRLVPARARRLRAQERDGAPEEGRRRRRGAIRSRSRSPCSPRRPMPAKLAPYREAGIDRVLFEVPDLGRDEILRVLDKNAPLHQGLSLHPLPVFHGERVGVRGSYRRQRCVHDGPRA